MSCGVRHFACSVSAIQFSIHERASACAPTKSCSFGRPTISMRVVELAHASSIAQEFPHWEPSIIYLLWNYFSRKTLALASLLAAFSPERRTSARVCRPGSMYPRRSRAGGDPVALTASTPQLPAAPPLPQSTSDPTPHHPPTHAAAAQRTPAEPTQSKEIPESPESAESAAQYLKPHKRINSPHSLAITLPMQNSLRSVVHHLLIAASLIGPSASVDVFAAEVTAAHCKYTRPKLPPDAQLVNLNTASETEIRTIPRIGTKTASAIVKYRQSINGFTSMHQLRSIRGIGDMTYACLLRHGSIK